MKIEFRVITLKSIFISLNSSTVKSFCCAHCWFGWLFGSLSACHCNKYPYETEQMMMDSFSRWHGLSFVPAVARDLGLSQKVLQQSAAVPRGSRRERKTDWHWHSAYGSASPYLTTNAPHAGEIDSSWIASWRDAGGADAAFDTTLDSKTRRRQR